MNIKKGQIYFVTKNFEINEVYNGGAHYIHYINEEAIVDRLIDCGISERRYYILLLFKNSTKHEKLTNIIQLKKLMNISFH